MRQRHNLSLVKIAMIGNHWYPERGGGLERYFGELVEQLASQGHEVDFFAYGAVPTEHRGARGYSLGEATQPLWQRLVTAYKIFSRQFTKVNGYELIDIHFALTALPALLANRAAIPIVCHFHGPWSLEAQAENASGIKVKLAHFLERMVYSQSQICIVASKAFANILTEIFSIESRRIHVIPLSIDTNFFNIKDRQECRDHLQWAQKATIVFLARRLVHRVGITEMLHAIAQFSKNSQIQFLIAGRGPLKQHFHNLIDELGISDITTLIGYISDEELAKAYSAADVVILPSQHLEGFGLAFAEALACGTPAIVTPIGGMPEYVTLLCDALVAKGPDATSIATALRQLLDEPAILPSARVCRDFALKHFSWSERLPQIIQLYRNISASR